MSTVTMNEKVVGEWMESGEPFVFYRLPDEETCHGIRSDRHTLQCVERISFLSDKTGFVFAPFQSGKGQPLWLLPPKEEVCFSFGDKRDDVPEAPTPVPTCGVFSETPSQAYSDAFARFSSALRSGGFQKLVLSRRWQTACPPGFNVQEAFRVACRRYVRSYVYLFYTPQTGFWLGATPELLLSGLGNDYKTVALAGTQALTEGQPWDTWSDKNIREQRYVTDYICDCLRKHDISPTVKPPRTVTAGALAHLKTEIEFTWTEKGHIGNLLEDLHPTPAVCGVPKREAYRFICDNEGYDRGYYSGFLGRLDPEGKTELYVNLRCMQVDNEQHRINLFAGGGLLAMSRCEDEWVETERKLQTMKYVIHKSDAHVFG